MDSKNLTVIIPVYNEDIILEKNINSLRVFLKKSKLVENFEILICDNGSTDATLEKARKLSKKYPVIRALSVGRKGLGLGIRLGIENAKYDLCFFYAIDLPFGLDIIEESIKAIRGSNARIIINSKEHPDSKRIQFDLNRLFFSRTYNLIINILYGLGVKDTQGSLMFYGSDIKKFIKHLDSQDAFLQTEILIYGKLYGLAIQEIPVTYLQPRKVDSKIHVLRDGWSMLKQLLSEYLKYKKLRKSKE